MIRVPFSADKVRLQPGAAAELPARQWPPWVCDTREQTPWLLPGILRCTLDTGDLSCCLAHAPADGRPGLVTIERKSHADCWGVIGNGRERFERELERMAVIPYRLIVVEATARSILVPPPQQTPGHVKGRYLHPSHAMGSLIAWMLDRCPVVFWDDHATAANWAARWLLKAHERAARRELEREAAQPLTPNTERK